MLVKKTSSTRAGDIRIIFGFRNPLLQGNKFGLRAKLFPFLILKIWWITNTVGKSVRWLTTELGILHCKFTLLNARVKWYLTAMCFDRSWDWGIFVSLSADWLSTSTGVDRTCWQSRFFKKRRNETTSLAADASALYSASVDSTGLSLAGQCDGWIIINEKYSTCYFGLISSAVRIPTESYSLTWLV